MPALVGSDTPALPPNLSRAAPGEGDPARQSGAGSPVHRSLWGWKCVCMCLSTCGHGLLANR